MSKVLLFNATGSQGQTILRRLLEQGHSVVAPVRSKEKLGMIRGLGAEAFVSDLSSLSLAAEIEKVDKVVLQIPAAVAPEAMVQITKAATEAIQCAGNPKTVFVISSTIPTSTTQVSSVDARRTMVELAANHMPDTPILSSTEYLENLSTAYRQPIVENGVIPQTVPATLKVNYLSWDDLASYVIAALDSDELLGQVYPIGGKEGIDGNDLAQRLGKVIGREVHYAPISHEQLRGFLTPIMGPDVAKDYAEFYQWQDTTGASLLNPDTSQIRQKLGVELTSFEDWAIGAFNR
ncbi:MAG: NmrA family NAD(P)-binding protein [Bacteroidota bacterium]